MDKNVVIEHCHVHDALACVYIRKGHIFIVNLALPQKVTREFTCIFGCLLYNFYSHWLPFDMGGMLSCL